MASRKLLVVLATGHQGGALIEALLAKKSSFEIYGPTRNKSSPSATKLSGRGVHMIEGDGVFFVTTLSKDEEGEAKPLIDAEISDAFHVENVFQDEPDPFNMENVFKDELDPFNMEIVFENELDPFNMENMLPQSHEEQQEQPASGVPSDCSLSHRSVEFTPAVYQETWDNVNIATTAY